MLAQLLTSKPLAPSRSKAEEISLSSTDKDSLEEKIVAHSKTGWRLRFRSYSAEGEHSATMFRSVE